MTQNAKLQCVNLVLAVTIKVMVTNRIGEEVNILSAYKGPTKQVFLKKNLGTLTSKGSWILSTLVHSCEATVTEQVLGCFVRFLVLLLIRFLFTRMSIIMRY